MIAGMAELLAWGIGLVLLLRWLLRRPYGRALRAGLALWRRGPPH